MHECRQRRAPGGSYSFTINLAGLWERWEPPAGDPVESFCILTTDADALMAPIHDRMPVIVDPDAYTIWLDPNVNDAAELIPLRRPYEAAKMHAYRVSHHVNSPANEGRRCIESVTDAPPQRDEPELFEV